MVKDMLVDHHFRLIGQQTSEPGIFIGPLFYYSLIPFYLLGGMDPAASVAFSWLIGLISMLSLYYVMRKIHGYKPALISTLIYAVSFLIVITERDVVPTTPVMLWTIWAYYAIHRRNINLMAVLLGLVWHLNLALVLLTPLFAISIFSDIKHLKVNKFITPVIIFVLLSLPLIIFETRHSFIQSNALISSLVSIESKSSPNLLHTLSYAAKNINNLFYFDNHLPQFLLLIVFIALAFWLTIAKKVPPHFFWLVLGWQILFLTFFTLHPINLSEYYLNGMNIIWIIIAGLSLANLPLLINFCILVLFAYLNIYSFFSSPVNKVGYLYKKALISYIKLDSLAHGYPCISISYMTNPGYELGYRYFFYLAGLHVNQPSSGSPVYTIVFPHPRANELDKTFGALGVVDPNYSQYRPETVKITCSGQNSNLTDPMFGFTK